MFVFIGSLAVTYGLGWGRKVNNQPVTWNDIPEVLVVPIIYYFAVCGYFLIYMTARRLKNVPNKYVRIPLITIVCTVACSMGFVPFIMISGMH